MIGASALFGAALAWASGLHPVTLMVDTAPGGIAEMAITAKVLQLGVAVVTAFQVCPLVAVLLLAEPIYRRWVMPGNKGEKRLQCLPLQRQQLWILMTRLWRMTLGRRPSMTALRAMTEKPQVIRSLKRSEVISS